MWIHESFASYAEFLNYSELEGRDSALRQLNDGEPANKEPIIGVYDVNHFHMPVKITVSKDSMGWIYPTTTWQTMEIKNMSADALSVDTKEFYVGVRVLHAITSH